MYPALKLCPALKRVMRISFGLYPLHEWRNRVQLFPGLARSLFLESSEVRRIRRQLGTKSLGPARVATIITTYKRPAFLQEAVASALGQTIEDQIVVVIDDAGGQIPALPDDPRLYVCSLSRNTGIVGVNRNIGLRITQSQYVAFLDDDNTWTPQHLMFALRLLEADPETGLVVASVQQVRVDGEVVATITGPICRKALREQGRAVDSSAIVARRARRLKFSRLKRRLTTIPGEDWELVYRLSSNTRVRRVDASTVRYVVHDGSYYTSWR